MSNKTRKHIWPVSLVMSIAIIGALAAFLVLASNPGETQAHGEWVEGTPHCPRIADEIAHNEGTFDHTCTEGPNNAPMAATATLANQTVEPDGTVMVQSTITDADAGDTLEWSVSSSDESVATVVVNQTTGMVTVTGVGAGMALITVTLTDQHDASASQTFTVTVEESGPMAGDVVVESSSTSGSATVELKLTVKLNKDVPVGGAFVLYLEDDYQEPDSISASDVYFVSMPARKVTGNASRVYATQNPEIDTDDHFTADKDDIDIRLQVPDMCANNEAECEGANGLMSGDTVTVVIQKSGGIKNPSEAGTHSVGASVLGPVDNVGGPMYRTDKVYAKGSVEAGMAQVKTSKVNLGMRPETAHEESADVGLKTLAKIGLSDVDNSRGYELTVTGSGFNNGTSAAVHVLGHGRFEVAKWWETLDCAGMKAALGKADSATNEACFHFDLDEANNSYKLSDPLRAHDDFKALSADDQQMYVDMVFSRHLCRIIIQDGARAGIATVGSDDKVAVSFEVTVPTFVPGNNNYICMVDGEGRTSSTDVEDFKLEPSIRVVPSSASTGDTINVFAQDYPNRRAGFSKLKIAGQDVTGIVQTTTSINDDGSGTVTFELPGSIEGSSLEGTLRVDAEWCTPGTEPVCVSEDGKVTVLASALRLSKSEVRANDSITIQGEGFGDQTTINPAHITMDGVPLYVDNSSLDNGVVKVSNAGQFVATIAVWNTRGANDNPALIAGTHTIKVKDSGGFLGTATIVVKEPSIKTLPLVAGPRDVITITGEDWPVDNPDGGNVDSVKITIDDDPNRDPREYTAIPDLTGRFTFEHRVSRDVGIPSDNQIKVSYGGNSEIVKISSFAVPESIIEVSPAEAQPGETISLSVSGMPVYTNVYSVEVGGRNVLGGQNFSTDRTGAVTSDVIVPGLDPGTYSVIMEVGEPEHLTIAIGEVEILAEGAIGTEVSAAEGLANLGDNLIAVFHFNNAAKEWSFYDPRPEFADLNTLDNMVQGEAYWILISEDVDEVVLNNKVRSLTCRGDDCWNLEVW